MSNSEKKYYKKNQWYKKKGSKKQKENATNNPDEPEHNTSDESQSPENNTAVDIYTIHKTPEVPYYGWKIFFQNEKYKDSSDTVKKIRIIEEFLQRHEDLSLSCTLEELKADMVFNVNVEDLYNDEILMSSWKQFKNDLEHNAEHTLSCLRLAIYNRISRNIPEDIMKVFIHSIHGTPAVRIKLFNYQPVVNLRDLPRIESYEKLICTRGCVIRVERPNQLIQWLVFSCTKCGLQKIMKLQRELYTVPKRCDTCGAAKFKPVPCSPYTKSILFQMIRIQEILSNDEEDKGRMPITVEVKLTDDLVNTCLPGDDVTVIGMIKIQGIDGGISKKNIANSVFIEGITVINNKNRSHTKNTQDEMTMADYMAIKEIHDQPDAFRLLIHSLCPDIYGHEMIKAGLILSLFGGNTRQGKVRDGIHVLVVGDPGLGKSQMLQACARVAQKGVYICGNSSTSSGLTVTLARESLTNDYALEPGALVLADKGCCCIDEFDKMSDQHQALLEAMEQQRVSVAKSGVLCSLPARTAILAAANPIGGRYNKAKTILENLSMSQPILSRFDLVFLLLDDPNAEIDSLLCRHVMSVHSNEISNNNVNGTSANGRPKYKHEQLSSLRDRLPLLPQEYINRVPHPILRKYITYARQYVKPRLTVEATQVIKKYYLELRSREDGFAGIPICTRQLEALIRLTEARAKVDLRDEANEADASDVVEILRYTMTDRPVEETVALPRGLKSGKITANTVKGYVQLLKKKIKLNGKRQFTMMELQEIAEDGGCCVDEFSNLISKLNEHGFLLKTGTNIYKFVSD